MLWSFEVNQSFHRLNQFAKKLRFLNELFQLWRFLVFPSGFTDEIDSQFFFTQTTQALKKIEKNQISYILNHFAKKIKFFKKAIRAFKLWPFWIHFLGWSDLPKIQFFLASYLIFENLIDFTSFSRLKWFEKTLCF